MNKSKNITSVVVRASSKNEAGIETYEIGSKNTCKHVNMLFFVYKLDNVRVLFTFFISRYFGENLEMVMK